MKQLNQKFNNQFVWIIAGLSIVAIISVSLWSKGGEDKNSELATANHNFQATNLEQPVFQVDREEIDIGTMSVDEARAAEFTVTNTGGKPLEITSVKTSCMCTFAEVIIGNEKSPAFNMEMHNSFSAKRWKGVISPGGSAKVQVIYKPSLMPVQGSVARNVKFNTNDPTKQSVELTIYALVR